MYVIIHTTVYTKRKASKQRCDNDDDDCYTGTHYIRMPSTSQTTTYQGTWQQRVLTYMLKCKEMGVKLDNETYVSMYQGLYKQVMNVR